MNLRSALSAPAPPGLRAAAAMACSLGLLALGGMPDIALSQALVTNPDPPNVTTYFVVGPATAENIYDINYSYPYGVGPTSPSWQQVTGKYGRPGIAAGSSIASYVNTVRNSVTEEFYLTPAANGLHVEQLLGQRYAPTDLHTLTNSSVPAVQGSNVVGFIDYCALTDNVFYVGTDQHIHMLTWGAPGAPLPASAGWKPVDLTLATGTVPVGGLTLNAHEASQSEEIFYVGTDHHVHELWRWSGCSGGAQYDGWHNTDVTMANQNGSPPASFGPLTSFFHYEAGLSIFPIDQGATDAVFFVDSSGHLHELYMTDFMNPVGEWVHVDVTSQTGVTVRPGSSLASQAIPYAQEAVYFLDASSNVWAATSAPNAQGFVAWSALNVTTATGAVAASAHSPLAADVDYVVCEWVSDGCGDGAQFNSQSEIYYRGNDDHIHLLWTTESWFNTWFETDLTAATGAPNPL